jgi:tRNA-specific 2-thiouridylase
VISLDAASGTIVVGPREEALGRQCSLRDVHWIEGEPKKSIVTRVKIRYNHTGAEARINVRNNNCADVTFKHPQFAITPGQSAVFYSGAKVLGGGIICDHHSIRT